MKYILALILTLTTFTTAYAGPMSTIILTDRMNEPTVGESTEFSPLNGTLTINEDCTYDHIRKSQYGNIRISEDPLHLLAYQAERQENAQYVSQIDLRFLRNISARLANSGNSRMYISPHQALTLCNLSIKILGEDIVDLAGY